MDTYLLNRLEVVLHALDGDVLASLDALGLKNFRKGALTFLANQPILLHFIYLETSVWTEM